MSPVIRVPTRGELEDIAEQLKPTMDRRLGAGRSSPSKMRKMFEAGAIDAVIIDDAYGFIYKVSDTWYSENTRVLCELGIYRYSKGSHFNRYLDALLILARKEGCNEIQVGTSLARSDAALARMYARAGFYQTATALSRKV